MLRSMMSKWVFPVAGLSLVLGLGVVSRAEDMTAAPPATTMPAAKGSIVVTVVDADGKAVDGATVTYKPFVGKHAAETPAKPADAPAAPAKNVLTDTDGKATLPAVADGDYTVTVKMKKVGNGHGKVTVADGKPTDVTITLKPKKPKA